MSDGKRHARRGLSRLGIAVVRELAATEGPSHSSHARNASLNGRRHACASNSTRLSPPSPVAKSLNTPTFAPLMLILSDCPASPFNEPTCHSLPFFRPAENNQRTNSSARSFSDALISCASFIPDSPPAVAGRWRGELI